MSRKISLLLLFSSLLVIFASVAYAADSAYPQGPSSINTTSSRFQNSSSPVEIQAEAGNITAMKVHHTLVTQSWQGYYGNITGTITLSDASNNTLYDWDLANPQGEIFAANSSTIDWSNIHCINVSQAPSENTVKPDGTVLLYNVTKLELQFGVNVTDADGLNETFTTFYTDSDGFFVGPTHFNGSDGCSTTHPYVDSIPGDTSWTELLLTDNSSIVFTALLRENANGFQTGSGDTVDFQMLVLENGHPNQEAITTPYYFYVELE